MLFFGKKKKMIAGNFLVKLCHTIKTLNLYATNIGGQFPRFTNPNLSTLEMRYTSIVGGYKDGSTVDNNHVISDNTFKAVSYTHLTLPTNREV